MFTLFKRMTWKSSLLITLISLLAFTVAMAAPGDLDGSFDGDGLVTTNVVPSNPGRSDFAQGIAIQLSGVKIVAAGFSGTSASNYDFAVTRYKSDGSLDTTFSGDGRLITDFGAVEQAYDVAVQPDGKIIAAGRRCNVAFTICNVAMARYNTNGTLDNTFSRDGKVVTDYGGGDNGAYSIALQPDGRIVLAGWMWNGAEQYDFAIYRYKANGSLDTSFSGDGMAHGPVGTGQSEHAHDLVIQTDGKILVVGATRTADGSNSDFAIARLNANGTPDNGFSGDAWRTTNFGAEDAAKSLALQPDGKIVVVGQKSTPPDTSYVAMARYNANGSFDTTFNGIGRKSFSFPAGTNSYADGVIVQSNGKIIVMGSAQPTGGTTEFALARLTPGGAFDTTFSGDGKVTIDFGGYEFGLALARAPSDGKYVLGGYTIDGAGGVDFALARVLP